VKYGHGTIDYSELWRLDLLAFRKSARMLHDVYGGGN